MARLPTEHLLREYPRSLNERWTYPVREARPPRPCRSDSAAAGTAEFLEKVGGNDQPDRLNMVQAFRSGSRLGSMDIAFIRKRARGRPARRFDAMRSHLNKDSRRRLGLVTSSRSRRVNRAASAAGPLRSRLPPGRDQGLAGLGRNFLQPWQSASAAFKEIR